MSAPHIHAVELADDGLVVIFDDASCAFYHESIFQAHLLDAKAQEDAPPRKPVHRASHSIKTRVS